MFSSFQALFSCPKRLFSHLFYPRLYCLRSFRLLHTSLILHTKAYISGYSAATIDEGRRCIGFFELIFRSFSQGYFNISTTFVRVARSIWQGPQQLQQGAHYPSPASLIFCAYIVLVILIQNSPSIKPLLVPHHVTPIPKACFLSFETYDLDFGPCRPRPSSIRTVLITLKSLLTLSDP